VIPGRAVAGSVFFLVLDEICYNHSRGSTGDGMRMNIRCALMLTALAVAMMVGFALTDRNVPLIPGDIFHATVINNAACTTCHTPGKQAPLKASHPPDDECMFCHKT
jgi:hypothetical protein